MATTALRSCREDLGRAVPRTAIWYQRRSPIYTHASSPPIFYSGDVAGCAAMKRGEAAPVSWKVLPLLSELFPNGRCKCCCCACSLRQIARYKREKTTWTLRKSIGG